MLRYACFMLCFHFSASAVSDIVNFSEPAKNRNVTFFLSSPKSGTNVITGSLSAITRKPISWFYWGDGILDPDSNNRNHISYNRLGLPLITDIPLLYRTHYQYDELCEVPSRDNKLIFLTRNPKELIYRKFFLEYPSLKDPDPYFIEEFLVKYLKAFEIYDSWCSETRFLLFYEDFIARDEETLLRLLEFMDEAPTFLDDYLENKEEYLRCLLESYSSQHIHNDGGISSRDRPKPIHYTRDASPDTLKYIDEYLQLTVPRFWEKYLNRFQIDSTPKRRS